MRSSIGVEGYCGLLKLFRTDEGERNFQMVQYEEGLTDDADKPYINGNGIWGHLYFGEKYLVGICVPI